MQDIAGIALPPGFRLGGLKDLAAALELMAPQPAVLEVADRPQHLVAPVGVLPVTIAAAHDETDDVFESWGGAVGCLRPIGAELPSTQLEEGAVADAGVPFDLANPAPRQPIAGRVGRVVDRRASRELAPDGSERLEPERLMVTAGLPERNHTVTWRKPSGGLACVVGQTRADGLDREVHLAGGDVLVTKREVPPERVGPDVPADVGVDVVIAPQPVRLAGRHRGAPDGTAADLFVIDVERLPVPVPVVGEDRAAILIASGLADELHLHARCVPLGPVRARTDRDLLERAEVEAEPRGDDAADAHALDHGAVEPRRAVRAVRARVDAAAPDVEARHIDRRACGKDGPHGARARKVLQPPGIEGRPDGCPMAVNHRARPVHAHRLGKRLESHHHVDGCAEAGGEVNAFAGGGTEALESQRQRVGAGRQRRKPERAGASGACLMNPHQRGAVEADGDPWQDRARGIGRGARDHAGGGARRLPPDRRMEEEQAERHGR